MPPHYQPDFLAPFDFVLPPEYLAYLLTPGNLYTFDAGYLVEAKELAQFNADYEATEFYVGYFLIGAQDGELFAIEKDTGYFVMTPSIGHDEETPILIGRTWAEFFERLKTDTIIDDDC